MEHNNLDEQAVGTGNLPMFLKVLCILTFVGSGLGILSGIVNFTVFSSDTLYDAMVQNSAVLDSTIPPYEEYAKWSMYNNIVSLIASLIGIGSALLMWNRKRAGYFLYIFSWVAGITMSFVSYKHITDSVTAQFFPFIMVLTVLIMAAFVIMYGVNLKHMNK